MGSPRYRIGLIGLGSIGSTYLKNLNAWYHQEIQSFTRQGEIVDLAVLDILH